MRNNQKTASACRNVNILIIVANKSLLTIHKTIDLNLKGIKTLSMCLSTCQPSGAFLLSP